MNKSMLQRILHRNKLYITQLLRIQAILKQTKSYADATGNQDAEFAAHNQLKVIRSEVSKLVDEQKAIKSIVNSKG